MFTQCLVPCAKRAGIGFSCLVSYLGSFLRGGSLKTFFAPRPCTRETERLLRRTVSHMPSKGSCIVVSHYTNAKGLRQNLSRSILSRYVISAGRCCRCGILRRLVNSGIHRIVPPVRTRSAFSTNGMENTSTLAQRCIRGPVVEDCISSPSYAVVLFRGPPFTRAASVRRRGHNRKGGSSSN